MELSSYRYELRKMDWSGEKEIKSAKTLWLVPAAAVLDLVKT